MEALSGNRYEHIPVRLTEAIHGFRHFRKEPPSCPLNFVVVAALARLHFHMRTSAGIIDPYCL